MTMLYRGLRQFQTKEPAQLASDLLRQNQMLEEGFGEAERQLAQRWRVVKATDTTHQAAHGDFVLANFNNRDTDVLLPLGGPDTAGRAVRVARVGTLGTVRVVATNGQEVNAATSAGLGSNAGFREYVDDGFGGWWGPAT